MLFCLDNEVHLSEVTTLTWMLEIGEVSRFNRIGQAVIY